MFEGPWPGHCDGARGRRLGGAGDLELVRIFQSGRGDDPDAAEACEILIRRHEALVWSCVRRYLAGPEPADDLMQVGYMGLMKAINNFDPDVGDNLAARACSATLLAISGNESPASPSQVRPQPPGRRRPMA